jgi:hypothetical protein
MRLFGNKSLRVALKTKMRLGGMWDIKLKMWIFGQHEVEKLN